MTPQRILDWLAWFCIAFVVFTLPALIFAIATKADCLSC